MLFVNLSKLCILEGKTMINKKCLYCKKDFWIDYKVGSSGSANCLRKKYCSAKCKRLFQKTIEGNRVELICEVCKIPFYLPPSLINSNSKCCSKKCKDKRHGNLLLRKEIKKCLYCKQDFLARTKQKYCNTNCFELSKKKEMPNCLICGKPVKRFKRKYCSKDCASEAQSKGLIKCHLIGNKGYRLDISDKCYFKSSLEADYARYLIYKNIKFEYEKKTFKIQMDIMRNYTPDFYLIDEKKYVDTKGIKKPELYYNILKINELNKNGENIEIIYGVDFYAKLRKEKLYELIPNLENRDKKKVNHLIVKQ